MAEILPTAAGALRAVPGAGDADVVHGHRIRGGRGVFKTNPPEPSPVGGGGCAGHGLRESIAAPGRKRMQ